MSVSLDVLEPVAGEHGTTGALVRGMAALLARKGLVPAGFDCVLTSDVPVGSGLSSSAAFEVELARGMDALWSGGDLPREDLALMAQADEREFFGKPCGLMDQTASAVGGIVGIDFADPARPRVERIEFDFGHDLDEVITRHRFGPFQLRWIVLHCVRETAQHVGHAEILREQVLAARD